MSWAHVAPFYCELEKSNARDSALLEAFPRGRGQRCRILWLRGLLPPTRTIRMHALPIHMMIPLPLRVARWGTIAKRGNDIMESNIRL